MSQLECSFADYSVSHSVPQAFLPSTPPPRILSKRSAEKCPPFSENTSWGNYRGLVKSGYLIVKNKFIVQLCTSPCPAAHTAEIPH
ncbi:hypothetical protein P879_11708 [Paragonimus westermani]|uniref:Uncharacterized protein n=1 Tax=Paragonimus westermani TaxID=34504 RepID=A0A8T0D7G6_9TREM|nr:hypothetical protein P879_11708 [Paragonimus westermani]